PRLICPQIFVFAGAAFLAARACVPIPVRTAAERTIGTATRKVDLRFRLLTRPRVGKLARTRKNASEFPYPWSGQESKAEVDLARGGPDRSLGSRSHRYRHAGPRG